MTVSPVLARLLADGRATFNSRVASVRLRYPGLDTEALDAFLCNLLDPLLNRVVEAEPDCGAAFLDACFDMALALTEHGWTGGRPRARVVERLWQDVAPAIVPAIARDPRVTLGALTNAAIKLASEPAACLDRWMAIMARLGGRAGSPDELRALAVLAAWRSGVAHLREAALEAAIDPAIACEAVGAEGRHDWPVLVEYYRHDRWWTPDRTTRSQGHRLGDFTGFGGRFAEPPRLAQQGAMIVVASGRQYFELAADAYGATLRQLPEDVGRSVPLASHQPALKGRAIQAEDRLVPCQLPQDGLIQATTADTIAVASRLSYSVQVFPRALP